MSAVRALHPSKCPLCGDPILQGDSIVQHSDAWIHSECEPSGETGRMNPAVLKLAQILCVKGAIGTHMVDEGFSDEEVQRLPVAIGEALKEALVAENALFRILGAVASEHGRGA